MAEETDQGRRRDARYGVPTHRQPSKAHQARERLRLALDPAPLIEAQPRPVVARELCDHHTKSHLREHLERDEIGERVVVPLHLQGEAPGDEEQRRQAEQPADGLGEHSVQHGAVGARAGEHDLEGADRGRKGGMPYGPDHLRRRWRGRPVRLDFRPGPILPGQLHAGFSLMIV